MFQYIFDIQQFENNQSLKFVQISNKRMFVTLFFSSKLETSSLQPAASYCPFQESVPDRTGERYAKDSKLINSLNKHGSFLSAGLPTIGPLFGAHLP